MLPTCTCGNLNPSIHVCSQVIVCPSCNFFGCRSLQSCTCSGTSKIGSDFSGYLSFAKQPHPLCGQGNHKPALSWRDNGSGAMPKLHTCRLAHAHLVFALVITNRITLWAHFVHTYMDTPPLTTYMYMYMLYTILLVSWPSPYTVAFSLYSGLLPIQLAFSL